MGRIKPKTAEEVRALANSMHKPKVCKTPMCSRTSRGGAFVNGLCVECQKPENKARISALNSQYGEWS